MHKHLNALLRQLDIRLPALLVGSVCKGALPGSVNMLGQFHLLRKGAVSVHGPDGGRSRLTEPSFIYFTEPSRHRLESEDHEEAELICAPVESAAPFARSLVRSMPAAVTVPLKEIPGFQGVLEVMFSQAADGTASGGAESAARLGEIALQHIIRWAAERRKLTPGTVAGLADARLGKALAAIHDNPARPWKVGDLAHEAGLSRAHFSAQFSEVVGRPPADYLAAWRVATAQALLTRGRQLKSIADECGYGSANALSRAFVQHVGMRPTDWLAQQRQEYSH